MEHGFFILNQPAEGFYTLNAQSWSWQQAEYLVDAGTLAGLRQDSRAQLILIAQDAGENLKINLPIDLLSEAELSDGLQTFFKRSAEPGEMHLTKLKPLLDAYDSISV